MNSLTDAVLAVLSSVDGEWVVRFTDSRSAALPVTDLAVTRGDAVFETIAFFDGRPQALEKHLKRLASSARKLDMAEPERDTWTSAILAAVAEHPPWPELSVKVVLTRPQAGEDGTVYGWVHVEAAADHSKRRNTGVSIATMSRGVTRAAASEAPWLLMGAKTLSYALNMAATREAHRRGADEALFLSVEGFVMEGPISSVVMRRGNDLLTPDPGIGILEGTTQQDVFAHAPSLGLKPLYVEIHKDELPAMDAVWMLGSGSLALPVYRIDGTDVSTDPEMTGRLNHHLRFGRRA
ncbi:4-amino-4-deoxychorismate lyase [Arthrobacter sp. GAS37]|uniref:aminotransferase class IV n=1 Tax=Arthrobacter sp. GAS37 TaxID=3156261 RepID=UPI003832FD60